MKKSSILVVLLSVIVLVSAVAFAGDMPKFAEHQKITLDKPMVLVNSELPAGTYTIEHQMQGTEHYMIFHKTNGSKIADVKVKCNLVALTGKAVHSERHYQLNSKNQSVITELIFQGDEAKHVFDTPAL
ncbi:MAG TPA: hypothetical protein VGL89_18340 [Candidatus Koribacter sp.]|jgi:hypothetical protein